MHKGDPVGYSKKFNLFGRRSLCAVLILLLSGGVGVGISWGEDTASSKASGPEPEARLEEIQRALEEAEHLKEKNKEDATADAISSKLPSAGGNVGDAAGEQKAPSPEDSNGSQKPQTIESVKEQPPEAGVSGENETSKPAQGPAGSEQSPSSEDSEASLEESLSEYAVLENVTWESSEKKIILRLWVSGQATPSVAVIRDQQGMKMRLRPKGLATRMQRALSSVPPGVQSFSIREENKLTKTWGLEAPYYAVEEIQALFALPVQYSLSPEPGLLKVTFSLPRKIETKKIESVPEPIETIETLQRETLTSPEITLGTSYQSQVQLEDRILYGAEKPPVISDLKKERENAEFKAESGLPDNVRPVFDARHPPFGSAEYFKKHVHGKIRQTFDFTTNYNGGTTSAFGESTGNRAEPQRGRNLGTILGTPAIALLYYRPGTVDISTGYSASRDFPMTHNNFMYGLSRQNVNLGMGHYSKKRYALAMNNNLGITDGTIRQKINGKWLKVPSQSQQGYQLSNNAGLNYRLSKRLLWGAGGGLSSQWRETRTTGVRDQTFVGGLNSYFVYRASPRLDFLLGTTFSHIYKDTGSYEELTSTSLGVDTKGNNLQSVFLSASYRYSKKITLKGSLQGSLIDWDIAKIGGAVGITYQRTPHDDLSFRYSSSVVQDNTSMILARSVNTANGFGISLQRYESMGLFYNRKFDRGKTKGTLGVQYIKSSPLSGVYYGSSTQSTINYDILFTASIRRAILKNRAWLGLLYSYEFAPNKIRDKVTGDYDLTSNTSQNIVATMEYQF